VIDPRSITARKIKDQPLLDSSHPELLTSIVASVVVSFVTVALLTGYSLIHPTLFVTLYSQSSRHPLHRNEFAKDVTMRLMLVFLPDSRDLPRPPWKEL